MSVPNQMQAVRRHEGGSIPFVAPTDMGAGTVVIQGGIVGVSQSNVAAGNTVTLAVEGIFEVVYSGAAIAAGGNVYWKAADNVATNAATGNTLIGKAIGAVGATDDSAMILLVN